MAMTTGALAADVVLGVPNWASARATSNILKFFKDKKIVSGRRGVHASKTIDAPPHGSPQYSRAHSTQ